MTIRFVIALFVTLDKLIHNFNWGHFDLTTVRSYLLAHNLTPEDVGTSEEELMTIHRTNERRFGTDDYSTFDKLLFKFKWMDCDLATVRMYLLAHNLTPEDVGTSEEELMTIHRTNERNRGLSRARWLVNEMRAGESSVGSVRDALSRYRLTPEDAGTTEAEIAEIERAWAIRFAKGQFLVMQKHLPEVIQYLSYYNLVPEDIGTTLAHLEAKSRWCDQKFGREYLQYIREGNRDLVPGLRQFLLNRNLTPEDVGTSEDELVRLERTR